MTNLNKTLYLDCFSGISGNMMLGALIDLGASANKLEDVFKKLSLSGYKINIEKKIKCGIEATYVDIEIKKEHHHRHLSDIVSIIDRADLSGNVKEKSKRIFKVLAEAEAKVHGINVNKVHFHEVGAVDAILDIVGTAFCLEELNIDKIYTSPLNTGTGFQKCAHGIIPVPAPATVELLTGIKTYHNNTLKELTTPTGAAIVKALSCDCTNIPENFVSEKVGYGAGTFDLENPNVLRAYLGEIKAVEKTSKYSQDVITIETNIDDLNPEIYPYVMEKLIAEGALDVWITPIIMKKGRPGAKLSVLTKEPNIDILSKIILKETSAIGLRFYASSRIETKRTVIDVNTPFGVVKVKVAFYDEKVCNVAPEYEDCKEIAQKNDIPIKIVYQIALKKALSIYEV